MTASMAFSSAGKSSASRVLRPLGHHQDILRAAALGQGLIDLLGDEGHEGVQQLQQASAST